MTYEVIGLSGPAGCGKDYVYANHLRPRGFMQISLADHFKAELIGKGVLTFEEAFVTKPPRVRTILQLYGTELGRDVFGSKIWCNTLMAWMDIYNHHWGVTRFAIPDVRFINELDFIQNDLDGKVLRIFALERCANSALDGTQQAHSSESEMKAVENDRFNGILFNDPKDPDMDLQFYELFKDYGWNYEELEIANNSSNI